jgi:hypothetical protein
LCFPFDVVNVPNIVAYVKHCSGLDKAADLGA